MIIARSSLLTCAVLACATPAVAGPCTVVDGVIAEVSPGAFLESTETVTLKSSWSAEFRWEKSDKEGIGWMRITDTEGREIGWVPAGHDGVRCGNFN